ncbi:MAG: hypothetical protein PVSMB1_03640 [Gemmatimonadaceae bacterium]
MTLRAAVIGCGRIGSEFADDQTALGVYSHAGAYAACPSTELIGVCDTDQSRLEQCAMRWGVAARYRDAHVLLKEQRPDVVSVCTPDETHFELIRLVMESPGVRGVLAEKPLAQDVEQAATLVRLAKARDVRLAVNYSRRYATSHVALRELIRSGRLGDLQSVSGFYTRGTLHNGTHWFDLARFLVGEVAEVSGFDHLREAGSDPTFDAVLRFESGVAAHLQGCAAAAFSLFEMDLVATRGRARLIESGHVVEIYRVVDSPQHTGYRTLGLDTSSTGGMRDVVLGAVEDLVRCLHDGSEPRCSGVDGVAALAIAGAVRASVQTGQRVALRGC